MRRTEPCPGLPRSSSEMARQVRCSVRSCSTTDAEQLTSATTLAQDEACHRRRGALGHREAGLSAASAARHAGTDGRENRIPVHNGPPGGSEQSGGRANT